MPAVSYFISRPDRTGRRPSRLLVVAAVMSVTLFAAASTARAAAPALSSGPLLWTAPIGIDAAPIDALACPSTSLCVAVDHSGSVLWSLDPAAGPPSWSRADVDGNIEITSVSCPDTTLCVAVDGAGDVITSQDPAGGAATWTVAKVDMSKTQNNTDNAGFVLLRGVSCPATNLCVAVDAAGNALVSVDPTGGPSAWTTTHIDANTSYGCTGAGLACQPPLVGISCPATTLCVAADFSGNVLTTSDPTGSALWPSVSTTGGGLGSLYGISCPVIAFCATVDGQPGHAVTFDPLAPQAQSSRPLSYALNGIWCASQTLCLATVQTRGGISGLLGSFDPAAPNSTWSLSSLGGINAVACPVPTLCLAADDEGNVALGATTTSLAAGLTDELLANRRLPTIARLDLIPRYPLVYTTPIAAEVTVTWTLAAPRGQSILLAKASHRFAQPGTATLVIRLTRQGRQLFRAAIRRFAVTATATFSASTGSISETRKLVFSHPPRPKKRR